MAPVVPAGFVRRADQPEVSLVNQCRRLQGHPRRLCGQASGGKLTQLVVDKGKELSGSVPIPSRRRIEKMGHIGHESESNRNSLPGKMKEVKRTRTQPLLSCEPLES